MFAAQTISGILQLFGIEGTVQGLATFGAGLVVLWAVVAAAIGLAQGEQGKQKLKKELPKRLFAAIVLIALVSLADFTFSKILGIGEHVRNTPLDPVLEGAPAVHPSDPVVVYI